MKRSPYMNIRRVEFFVTYQCSGKCKHCSVGKALNPIDSVPHISAEEAARAVESLSRMFSVSSVMTFGGEPLLYPGVVCAVHERAAACGIGTRQLITNGYFSKDSEKQKQVAEALRESGVNNLLLSVDAFHQETIPAQIVHRFAQYALDAEIPNIRLHPAWLVNREHDNPYNARTKEVLAGFGDLPIPVSDGNDISMTGNAAKHFAQYYAKPCMDLSDVCGSMPYTERLDGITSLTIAPNGDVMVCGFAIGNIHREGIEEIVYGYNPYENECMRALLSGGARALLALAKEKHLEIDTAACYSVCDLCRMVSPRLS